MNTKLYKGRLIPWINTLSNWTLSNPVIPQGEFVTEIGGSVMKVKVGNGVSNYLALSYLGGGSGPSPADGTYLGVADPTTNPGTPVADSFYFSKTPGNYTHFPAVPIPGYIVMPVGDNLGIISFSLSTGMWTYRTLDSGGAIPTLEVVTLAGNTTDQDITMTGNRTFKVDNTTYRTEIIPNLIKTTLGAGSVIQSWIGVASGFAQVLLKDSLSAFRATFGVGDLVNALTADRFYGTSDMSGIIALTDPRTLTATSTSTLTPDSDRYDWFFLTAQTANLTIANYTGTPRSGRPLIITILFDGTPRTISFGSNYIGGTSTPLPTVSVVSKTLTLQFNFFPTDSKMHLTGINQE